MKTRISAKLLGILVIFTILCGFFGVVLPPGAAYAQGTWSRINRDAADALSAVWGSGADDVFTVGSAGTILHYDGSDWSEMASGATQGLQAVWGSGADDVFAVGNVGQILHYDGSAWSAMTSGTTDFLYGVWGSGADDVFAVGMNGLILHYDGSDWSAMTSGTTSVLFGVWGSGADDVFAVGSAGTILHYDGSDWSAMTSGATHTLYGIWGSGPDDVFIVGLYGVILHYDGSAWSTMTSPPAESLLGVWGSGPDDVYAVGYSGVILHYNGSAWGATAVGLTSDFLGGVWGSSSYDVYAVGDWRTIMHYTAAPPPEITTTSLPDGEVTVPYSQTLAATGGTLPYAWSISAGALPSWATLDAATGAITGTPDADGTTDFTVMVTDSVGATDTQSLSITIIPAPLAVTTTLLPDGEIGVYYNQTLAATGGTPDYTWSISAGSLPSWASLDAATGEITGTPDALGTTDFTVMVTDDLGATDTQDLSITVNPAPLVITTTSLPDGEVTVPYSQTLAATGGTLPYAWSISAGTLPAWATLDAATGDITGTPDAADTTGFTVMVTDDAAVTATQALSITIIAGPAITTASLPEGSVGVAYSATLSATGGTSPYTWSISAGALPSWAGLNASTGAITGTPDALGTTDFTVMVTDDLGVPGTQDLSITVTTGRQGGPDSFGYTFKDSNVPGGPAYNWIEITGTGTQILPDSDDNYVTNIALGFFFNYYGTDYSQVAISNNGLLFSGISSGIYTNEPITQTPSIHGFIAPFWDDIVTWNTADAIYYQTLGTAPNRTFIVEWHDNQHYSSSPSGITFEAILYEGSNNILFQYQDVDFGQPGNDNGGSATVGIEDPSGAIGLQYSYNQPWINPSMAILFKYPQFRGINLFLSKQAPATKDHGSLMTYTLYYHNFADMTATAVTLQDTLSGAVEFVSASDGGSYNATTHVVTWDIGDLVPLGHGFVTLTVRILDTTPVGTVIQNTAEIATPVLEVRYDDNVASAQTRVTGSNLPPNTGVGPTNSGGSTPSVYWGTPVTFSYDSCPTATGVDILIHVNDGGPDISAPMVGGPPHWEYTITFYPRHGQATITYTVHGCVIDTVVFDIYIDPAGYIYDTQTSSRIAGATVWLQRPDGIGGWENVPTDQSPAIMQPDVNPLTTGVDGQYQWDVLAGSYRVHVEAAGYYAENSIVVSIPPPVTDLHVGLTQLLTISTASLPHGDIGTAYHQVLAANGGATPYNWSISAGALPSWASLDAATGAITGTPNASGTTDFTVQLADSLGHTTTKALSITVNTAAVPAGGGGGGVVVVILT